MGGSFHTNEVIKVNRQRDREASYESQREGNERSNAQKMSNGK